MEFFFTFELVSNVSFNCYSIMSRTPFNNFLPDQIHFKREREVAISQISYHCLFQNVIEGMFVFIDGRKTSREKNRWTQSILNLDCIQILLI